MSSTGSKRGVDFDQTVGHQIEDQQVSWNRRDLLTYAAGIGAGEKDLEYTYELDHGFRAFPLYPVVLGLKGTSQDTTVFREMVSSRSSTPGFPTLSPDTIVHGEQSIVIHAPLPTVSGEGWKLKKRISAVHDKGSGLILETEVTLVSPVGRTHATMIGSAFYRGGGQGTGYSKSVATKPPTPKAPNREPDFTLAERTSPAQAVLYRLSGDYNPLHIDPSIGKKGGLGGVILHGLCSLGFATRAVLKSVDPRDGEPGSPTRPELKVLATRFTSPVKPGDELQTNVWYLGEKDGMKEIAFEQVVKSSGKKCLGGGYALVATVKNDTGTSSKL